MSCECNAHNAIASNALCVVGAQLRGKSCRPFNSRTSIHVSIRGDERFYYPDASVVCDSPPQTSTFQDRPVLVVEVLSESTRRIDTTEKQDAYLTIPSLEYYLTLEQDRPLAVLHVREGDDFVRRQFLQLDDAIELPMLGVRMTLAELYEGVTFLPPGVRETGPGEYDES